jgi:hypothetical protein
MIPSPKKISELSSIPTLSELDLLVFVDKSDTSSSPQGTTKKGSFGQIKQNILNSISLPKATTQNAGAIIVGEGLSIDTNGILRSEFSGSYNDLTNRPQLVSSIGDLNNVSIVQPQLGHVLVHTGTIGESAWINRRLRYEDLDQIPTNLVEENSSTTLNNLSITGNLVVTGTTISNNFETLNVGTSEIILNDQLGKFIGNAQAFSNRITGIDNALILPVNVPIEISSNGGPLTLPPGTKIQSIISADEIQLTNSFQGNGSNTDISFAISIQPVSNASVIINRSAQNDVELRWNEQINIWEFTNNGTEYHPIPTPAAYGNYQNLTNKPSIPGTLKDLSDVSEDSPSINTPFLRWNGTRYSPSSITENDLENISINALEDVDTSNPPTLGQVLKWNGNTWSPSSDLVGGLTTEGAIVTPSETSSIIPFFHETFDAFPNPTQYGGALAYTQEGGLLYYAHGNEWLELALADNVQPNTDTTYSIGIGNIDVNQRTINLNSSIGNDGNSSITVSTGTGISVTNNNNILILTGTTYSISAVDGDGNFDAKLRLTAAGASTVADDIKFLGADGLVVERDGDNTIVFRAPLSSVSQYTDNMAKDAMASAIASGTHIGITFTYDSQNKQLNSVVSGGGGGGGGTVVLYDLGVSNTTTNQAIISLTPSTGNADTFEIVGGNGTSVAWDGVEKKITISSTAPVNADWNATSGLAEILNKPTIPPAYTLPIASTSVLGGVKVDGSTINIVNGVISAVSGGYILPIASNSTLGGIKIGSGLSISGDGTVTVAAGDGGVPLQTRNVSSVTTPNISNNGFAEVTITGYKTYSLLKIATNADAWVRLYVDQASMIADRTRSEGNDPMPGSGVIAEIRGTGAKILTPAPIGFNNDSPLTNNIYVSVTNRSGIAQQIIVDLTLLRLEA